MAISFHLHLLILLNRFGSDSLEGQSKEIKNQVSNARDTIMDAIESFSFYLLLLQSLY